MAQRVTVTPQPAQVSPGEERRVIFASSLGTVFEWYDFYLYGTLAVFFGGLFFPSGNETASFLASLATFGAGFAVRPFGALVFGRLGDLLGRKYTFLITIVLMGVATAGVGLLPTYGQIGVAAPILLVTLRLVQGLALGGEYGGAATYVAEHAPGRRRGYNTSWIQTTATLGFFLSLIVILVCRQFTGDDAFAVWGWRIPFLISVILLGISVYIRLRLQESPAFVRMKSEGKGAKNPLRESFGNAQNLRLVLLSLFGATAGQAVVWYTGQFYALFFLQNTLKVNYITAYIMIAVALALATPFFVFFGWLSDRIGRKYIILAGCLLAAVTYIPLFHQLTRAANPALAAFNETSLVTVTANDCTLRVFNTRPATTSCDQVKGYLTTRGISYRSSDGGSGAALTTVGDTELRGFDEAQFDEALAAANYPVAADPGQINYVRVVLILFVLVFYVTMVYGPIAAYLVELFPTRIRYTSMSLPYHIGNGWFGGFLPYLASAIVVATGNIYAGLYYPIVIAVMTLIVGTFLLPETKGRITDDFTDATGAHD
ncbi:MAG: Uncharacterized MFS-type transporter [uncultured Truepera sp.]|uniref:Uncharacterized MFS-type transporter n=1 Tax=uncultured Truepera sp. TaxID=543023 RepID=A0A6J4UTH5_9DEIN|nr:MAG: Uncharacterized MFS-type transporter [uncultured Truepera sp.]